MLDEPIIPAVIARLKARVALFGERVHGAGNLAGLMRSGAVRQPQIAAWVIASGLVGRAGSAASGAYVQPLERGLTIITTLPAYDGTGASESDALEALLVAVAQALAGWTPVASPGALRLVSARPVSMEGGIITSQIDFSITDQMRIAP